MAADEVRRLTVLNPTSLLLTKDTHCGVANISLDQTLATSSQLNSLTMKSAKFNGATRIYANNKNDG